MTHTRAGIRHTDPRYLEGSPVRPLGHYEGWFFYQDSLGQRVALRATEHNAETIFALFAAAPHWLRVLWERPPFLRDTEPRIWSPALAAETLMAACAAVGIVEPAELGFPIALSGVLRRAA